VSNIGGDRPLRVCDLCGQVDDHPRHGLVGSVPGQAIMAAPAEDIVNKVLDAAPADQRARLMRELTDTSTSDRHLDCCAAAGCPMVSSPIESERAQSCPEKLKGADGVTGKKLLAHLESRAAEFTTAGEDA